MASASQVYSLSRPTDKRYKLIHNHNELSEAFGLPVAQLPAIPII